MTVQSLTYYFSARNFFWMADPSEVKNQEVFAKKLQRVSFLDKNNGANYNFNKVPK